MLTDHSFEHLIQHRFASHCCEKLFISAAPVVTQEMLHPPKPNDPSMIVNDIYATMEDLFIHTVLELQGNIGFLMTDRFASHALRVLLLILAGEPVTSSTIKTILQSKKKEDINIVEATDDKDEEPAKLSVPSAFTDQLRNLIQASISGLDTTSIRALAKHEQANPMLQLLLRIELTHFGKQRGKDQDSIIRQLLPDDEITPESESAIFISDLMYDSIGSHLVETIVEFAPAKLFKSLFKNFFMERIASLARNEVAGYVACKVLHRLSRDDLIAVHELIVPTLPKLLELNRINVIQTLIERCAVRKVETQGIAMQISEVYDSANGFDVSRLLKMDETSSSEGGTEQKPDDDPLSSEKTRAAPSQGQIQGSILAQAMILVPGPLSSLIFDSLAQQPISTLLQMASTSITSRTLQAAMRSINASIISRRKLVQHFYGHVGRMSTHACASHVVDAIWQGTYGLAFIRQRIAEELVENESTIRESPYGRAVWRNWAMDLYKRRRGDWIAQSRNKASDDGFLSFDEIERNKRREEDRLKNAQTDQKSEGHSQSEQGTGRRHETRSGAKTPLELARERHALKKKMGSATGANAARPSKTRSKDEQSVGDGGPVGATLT